jgi:hypothetical protein
MNQDWKNKTLESLENNTWPPLPSDENSYLIRNCNRLRKKLLNEFTVEDLREMIGQDIGLKFLIPMAVEILNNNILAEGDIYEGDLLSAVLSSDKIYWQSSVENWNTIIEIYQRNEKALTDFDTTWEIKKKWKALFEDFKNIN